MEYALQGRDQSFVEQSLLFCLKYRKSYCSHWSTDIELAWSVIKYIAKHFPTSNLTILKDSIFSLRETFQGYDNEAFTSAENMLTKRRAFNKARKNLENLLNNLGFNKASEFHYSNDNRYEQHHSFW
jgi:hypothetical protein